MTEKENTLKSKLKGWKNPIIIIGVLISILTWAGLTKMGYIPNFLDLEILCSKKTNNSFRHINYDNGNPPLPGKPVIYLYPTTTTEVNIKLDYEGKIIADYPKYNNKTKGWKVKAYPDGTLFNYDDNQEYSYLFREGNEFPNKPNWDLSEGFVVKGENTREFLQKTLNKMGLTPKEYNEFIVYWYPLMVNNKYNLIHFAGQEFTDTAPLTINPKPDSMLRVFMVYKALDKKINIKKQNIKPFQRNGFSVIEWGGTIIK